MKKILDGNMIAEQEALKQRDVIRLLNIDQKPSLAIIQVGDDIRSTKYIQRKKIFGEKVGALVQVFSYNAQISVSQLKKEIEHLQEGYVGVMIQLPIPGFSSDQTEEILSCVDIKHDVDCLNPETLDLYKNKNIELDHNFAPPVAGGVELLLKYAGIVLPAPELIFVVLGKGKTVGLPVAAMFERLQVTYIALDENSDSDLYTQSLARADVIVSGVGKAHVIKSSMIKDGVILIDAGVSFSSKGELQGDVDPECYSKASFYSPPKGGVGPVGISSLFHNLLCLVKNNI